MKRLAVIVFLFVSVNAAAQCTPALNDASLDVVSHGLWRGIDLGGRIFAEPRVDAGLCGRPATTTGTRGADLTVEGWIPLSSGGSDLGSVRARYLWYFGELKETSIAAGIRESHWGDSGPDPWTTELSIEARKRIAIESQGFRAFSFLEVAHDVHRFEATYARAGIDHEVGGTNLPFQIAATLYGSVSDYAGDFGFHDAQLSAWALRRMGAAGRVRVGVGGGYDRVSRDIGRSRAWAGVTVRLLN